MAPRSKLDRLPLKLQAQLAELCRRYTLDEVMQHLATMGAEVQGVSRSAVHRWASKQDEMMAEDLRESRRRAVHLALELGEAPHSAQAQVNIELLHDEIYQILRRAREARRALEAGDLTAAEQMDAKSTLALARATEAATRAIKTNLEVVRQIEKRAADQATKAAAETAVTAAKQRGIGAETAEWIKAQILGVPSTPVIDQDGRAINRNGE